LLKNAMAADSPAAVTHVVVHVVGALGEDAAATAREDGDE